METRAFNRTLVRSRVHRTFLARPVKNTRSNECVGSGIRA